MNTPPRPFQWRALTSVLVAAAFVLLVLTGIILFASPPGRVANWTNWNILGLRKGDWTGLHIGFSALFLVVAVVHLAFNWRPMLGYFKDRLTRRVGRRWEWVVAIVIVAGIFAGTRAGLPPFSWLLAWNEDLKQSWDSPAARAPIPHAELLTLDELAAKAGVPVETDRARLEARGVKGFALDTVVQKIADGAGLSAQQVYDIIQASGGQGQSAGGGFGGAGGGGGPGRKSLAQFCADEGLSVTDTIARLAAKGIQADEHRTLREIAVDAGFTKPYELIELLRGQPAKP